MSNNDEPSTSNGLGSDPQQRLTSLKPPRDLTLGGVKPNKKVFTPNLNVTRNKNKGPILSNARDQKKENKGKRDRRNDNKRNVKNGHEIIKSTGVFSEGFGAAERPSSRSTYASRDSGNSSATLQKPTIRVKDVIMIDKELEEQKIRAVMGQDDASDNEEDSGIAPETDAPIKLVPDAMSTKKPVAVKQVPEEDVVKLLNSEQPTLILLQLPDTLPGRGKSEPEPSSSTKATKEEALPDTLPGRGKSEPGPSSSSAATNEEAPGDNRCRLSDLEEGRIGTMRVHQSGKVTLLLGDTIFEVSAGTKAAFHQEVVAVTVDESSRSADVVSLGTLQHKLNLTPDWESIFQDKPA